MNKISSVVVQSVGERLFQSVENQCHLGPAEARSFSRQAFSSIVHCSFNPFWKLLPGREAGYPELIRLRARMTRIFTASFMTNRRHWSSEHSLALRHQWRSISKLTNHSFIQLQVSFLTYTHSPSHSFTVLVFTKVLIGKYRFGLEEPLPSRSCRASPAKA